MYRYITILIAFFFAAVVHAQKPASDPVAGDFGVGMVHDYQRISDLYGNFTGVLNNSDRFGIAVETLGDLNGDGNIDIAVGAHWDDHGGTDKGAVWILFMDTGRIVKSHYKIDSDTLEAAGDTLSNGDRFGDALANIGDLNDDGVVDLAVTAVFDDEGVTDGGAVYILFLDTNGHIKSSQKITEGVGGFMGGLGADDRFGNGIDGMGDFDGDGIEDLLVGAANDDDGGTNRGAMYILSLDTNGTVKSSSKISEVPGVYLIGLDNNDRLGYDVACIGDVNGDGVIDIAGGAPFDDDKATDAGAVWIFLMNSDGTVLNESKISNLSSIHFYGKLNASDNFGLGMAAVGDMNKDGIPDLAIGARQDDDGTGTNSGAVWFLYLDENGKTKEVNKISKVMSNFHEWDTWLGTSDLFGTSVAALGDYDGNGAIDIVVGAYQDDDGGGNRGAIYVIEMNNMVEPGFFDGYYRVDEKTKIFDDSISTSQRLGFCVTSLDTFSANGNSALVVGEYLDDNGGSNRGAVYILFFSDSATVDSVQKISDTKGGFTGTLNNEDGFGISCANIGDLDQDGIQDLAVGAYFDDDGASNAGAVWILFLNADGRVKSHQKISELSGGFGENLLTNDLFGYSIASIGDINHDTINDIAVGAMHRDDGGNARGAIWILMMNTDGTVKDYQRISDTEGGFQSTLDDLDRFGCSIAGLGDLNQDSIPDIAVGARDDDDGGTDYGAVYILFLDTNGTVKHERKINEPSGHFTNYGTKFGISLANLGDINYDGINDLGVGEYMDGIKIEEGGFHILLMDSSGYPLEDIPISSSKGGLPLSLHTADNFGTSLNLMKDIGGSPYIATGAPGTDVFGTTSGDIGAVYLLKGKKIVDKGPPFTPIFDTYGYAQLKKKLDGNYYHTQGSNLRVQYSEDYYVSDTKNLTYTIYDEQWNAVTNTPSAPIDFGDNRLSLNLGNTGSYPGDFFILEVENDKNEKEYLRFKYK